MIYFGAFAPNAKWRSQVVMAGEYAPKRRKVKLAEKPTLDLTDPLSLAKLTSKLRWATALKRSFGIDILRCSCGHALKLLAVIPPGPEAARFLRHLKLPAEPNDIVRVCGPPEAIEPPEFWDDFDPDPGEEIDLPFPSEDLGASFDALDVAA